MQSHSKRECCHSGFFAFSFIPNRLGIFLIYDLMTAQLTIVFFRKTALERMKHTKHIK